MAALLLGAGGHARVAAETALATARFNSIRLLDIAALP